MVDVAISAVRCHADGDMPQQFGADLGADFAVAPSQPSPDAPAADPARGVHAPARSASGTDYSFVTSVTSPSDADSDEDVRNRTSACSESRANPQCPLHQYPPRARQFEPSPKAPVHKSKVKAKTKKTRGAAAKSDRGAKASDDVRPRKRKSIGRSGSGSPGADSGTDKAATSWAPTLPSASGESHRSSAAAHNVYDFDGTDDADSDADERRANASKRRRGSRGKSNGNGNGTDRRKSSGGVSGAKSSHETQEPAARRSFQRASSGRDAASSAKARQEPVLLARDSSPVMLIHRDDVDIGADPDADTASGLAVNRPKRQPHKESDLGRGTGAGQGQREAFSALLQRPSRGGHNSSGGAQGGGGSPSDADADDVDDDVTFALTAAEMVSQ